MNVFDNKYLICKENVQLTETVVPVILAMEEYFKEANKVSYITSALRSPMDQLNLIRRLLKSNGLDKDYPDAFTCKLTDKKNKSTIYAWQEGWSKLLNVGIIINPPLPAAVLMDYMSNGINKKGKIIGQSSHSKGSAFDISGGENGVDDEAAIFDKAMGKVKGLVSTLKERKNNCLHVNCK